MFQVVAKKLAKKKKKEGKGCMWYLLDYKDTFWFFVVFNMCDVYYNFVQI